MQEQILRRARFFRLWDHTILILVDGCHSPEALKHDLEVAYNALDNESAMLVHDLELPNTGLGPAYQEWCRMKGVEHAELDKSIVVHGLGIVYKP